MIRRNLDLIVLEALMIAGWLVQLGTLPAAFRIIFGMGLVLLCPGYAVMAALFPKHALSRAERLSISAGLSLAMVILAGVMFNAAPSGLTSSVWSTVLAAITIAASCVAAARRDLSFRNAPESAASSLRLEQWAFLAAAGIIVVASFSLVRAPRPPSNVLGYTALWMVPDEDPAQPVIHLGISSSELEITQYQLSLSQNGRVIQTWDEISLAPGESWESQIDPSSTSAGNRLEALLYRRSAPDVVYRDVVLTR